jgi:hypothetical protein
MERGLAALREHCGELGRNDYVTLVRARAEMNRILGPERVFDYGAKGIEAPFAEVLTEAVRHEGRWRLGPRRTLDLAAPLPRAPGADILDDWLDAPGPAQRLVHSGPAGAGAA